MQRLIVFAATMLFAAPIHELAAQAVDTPLQIGGRKVQVVVVTVASIGGESTSQLVKGRGLAQRDDSIRVVDDRGRIWSFSRPQVQRLDVSLGRSHWRGAVAGAVLVTLFNLAGQLAASEHCWPRFGGKCDSGPSAELMTGPALVGALVGGVIGVEQWRTISLERRVDVRPMKGGLGLRIAF